MKLALRLTFLIVGVGLCVWLWIYLHPKPEEAIRRRLVKLAKAASFEGRQGNLAAAVGADDFAGFFAREVLLAMEPRAWFPDSLERAEITRIMVRVRTEFDSLDVKILDPIITVGADHKSAIVELTINAATSGDRHLLVQEMKFTMRELDGEWFIIRIETIRTLNRGPVLPLGESFPAA
jgi:hypothetical protein